MKKDYYVKVPFAGWLGVYVEAESEEEAEQKALGTTFSIDCDEMEESEFDLYRAITRGNVLYAPLNEIEAQEES